MSKKSETNDTKNSFYKRLCSYVVVIIVLGIINLVVSPGYLWVGWIALFGGIALIINFINVFFINDKFSD